MINLKSIRNNIGANSLTVIINIFFQLISVPILLTNWGVDLYGDWLILISLTSFFAMSDLGLNTVTTNEFCISYAKKQINRCNTIFNNNLFFIVTVFIVFFSILSLVLSSINLSSLFKLESISEAASEIILICLVIQVFTSMLSLLYDSIYRATDRNASGLMINNYVRAIENFLLIIGVLLNLDLVLIVLIYIIPRPLGLIYKSIETKRYFPLSLSLKYFDFKEFKKIIIPAIAFLSFPVGNSLVSQGFILIIKFLLGNTSVVVYNTTRTLINFVKVGLSLINNSVTPEFSLAYGRKDYNAMKKLHRYSVSMALYLSLFASCLMLIFGRLIYTLWTNDELEFNITLVICFLITLILNSFWYTSGTVLTSTNNHKRFSFYYLLSTSIALFLGFLITRYTGNINYTPLSLLVIDISLIFFVIKSSLNIVGDDFNQFIRAVLILPLKLIKKLQ